MIVSLLLAAAIQAPAPTPKPVFLPESYAHPFYAYKIYLPKGWQKGDAKGKVKNSFYGPKDGSSQPRLDLEIESRAVEPEKYALAYQEAYQKEFAGAKVVRYEAFTGRSGEGQVLEVSFSASKVEMTALWSFFQAGGRLFALGFTEPKANAGRLLPAIEAAMRSLRIFDVPKQTLEQQQAFFKLYNAAEASYKGGKPDEALKNFQKASELMPEFAEVHSAIAFVHMKQRNFKAAEPELLKAIELDPDDYRYRYDIGVCLLQAEKYKAAAEQLEKAVALDPTSEQGLTNLGVAYLADERVAIAAETLERAVKADPESAAAHYNLGMAYERLERKKEAAAEFRETLKVEPKHKGATEGLKRLKP